MCGIAGILSKTVSLETRAIKSMVKKLQHRGPDCEGIELFCDSHTRNIYLALGHRRLSIIDLSDKAHQPMKNEDGSLWIVHNGEIYNYRQLREELIPLGHCFISHSDTEVIIHAYEQWGLDCLHKFRGMFAFGIWDNNNRKLILATDRFGMKPVYYHHTIGKVFIFASEVRAILCTGLIQKQVDTSGIDSFLAYGAVQAPLTIIHKVYSLLPAHYLTYSLDSDKIEVIPYWTPSVCGANNSPDKRRVISTLQELLRAAVERHLVSDVPVGLFLSGGVDSSSVVILANELAKGTLQSFSVTFAETRFSEGKYSRLVAQRYCKNHREIKLSQQHLLDSLPSALEAMDQPTIDGINVYLISKVVREAGIKVVLSGQGGDEVFGGYSTFKRIPRIRMMSNALKIMPSPLLNLIEKRLNKSSPYHTTKAKLKQILKSEGDCFSIYLTLRQLFSSGAREKLIRAKSGIEMKYGIPLCVMEYLKNQIKYLDVFNSVSLLDMRLYLANMLLRDGDCMSMAHGLEVRMPFLDYDLVRYVFSVPSQMKLSKRLPKPLLIRAMRGMLPKAIYMRPKMGFTFPWELWLKSKLRSAVESVLGDFPLADEVGLNGAECVNVWHKFIEGTPEMNWARPWSLFVLLEWCKRNVM